MLPQTTRRQFLAQVGATAAGVALPDVLLAGDEPQGRRARVVIARDDTLTRGPVAEHRTLLCNMLDAGMQRLLEASEASAAWRRLFDPGERVGIKINTLGLSTQPVVVDAVVNGLLSAGLRVENIVIWDRFDVELAHAGFKLNKSARGVQCRGTDAENIGSGYQRDISNHGSIGVCFSRIVAEQVDALISVPVLKDHNLAGVSLGMKNFFGAIHNPNKYHDHNCDPYITDVVTHRLISDKWRLTVCDATRAQYHAGPGIHPGFAWPFGGLIVSHDVVAADAVAADLLETQRQSKGLLPLAEEKRPATHILTTGERGLGQANQSRIERIEV